MLKLYSITSWLEENMLSCPSKKYLHLDCPGCGIQRSFIALIKGDLYTSISLYPALIPIIVTVGYTILHLKFDFKQGARNIKIFQSVAALIIVCFYIYKIVTNQLTT